MSEKDTGFAAMAGDIAEEEAPRIGVGMMGYAFMGKAHTNAFKKIPYMMYPPPAVPELVAIAGRDEEAVSNAARRYGYQKYYTDWRDMVADPAIQLFDNGGPNNVHADPCIAAAEAGKHILCEKPLARTAEEAKAMLEAVEKANVKHMVAHNYRFVPAIRQIKNMIDSGVLGRIYHWRAVYLQEWILPHYDAPKWWRMDKSVAGSGAIGDLGSHIVDLAHYLVGGLKSLKAYTKTFVTERELEDGSGQMGQVDVDDAFVAMCEFENGALGTFEGTRFAGGRKNFNSFEINGEYASVNFNLERLNEFQVFYNTSEPKETRGWTHVNVSEGYHPWIENWWPSGHIIGWEHSFVHEVTHLLDAIVNDKKVGPHGATFLDGYRTAIVCDAIVKSAETKHQVDIKY